MSLFQRGDIWWYEFWFAGRRIRESSKSESKTVAKSAEKNRRRELEEGFNNVSDVRRERVRVMREIADEFFEEYKLRLPQSSTFAEYAIGHIKRLVGDRAAPTSSLAKSFELCRPCPAPTPLPSSRSRPGPRSASTRLRLAGRRGAGGRQRRA